jgi:hypothetical protein
MVSAVSAQFAYGYGASPVRVGAPGVFAPRSLYGGFPAQFATAPVAAPVEGEAAPVATTIGAYGGLYGGLGGYGGYGLGLGGYGLGLGGNPLLSQLLDDSDDSDDLLNYLLNGQAPLQDPLYQLLDSEDNSDDLLKYLQFSGQGLGGLGGLGGNAGLLQLLL